MTQTWGIIGMGWLGQKLSENLSQKGVENWGTRSQDFDWGRDDFPAKSCDVLFLNTPPLVQIAPEAFVAKIPTGDYRRIIFISSISVYGHQAGRITEQAKTLPSTDSARWLVAVEMLLSKKFKDHVTVIRPGGLIGGDRHPAKSLSQSQRSCAGNAPVNLIHRDDLVQIIVAVAEAEAAPSVINAVTPFHPTKKEYYSEWTAKLGIAPVQFTEMQEPAKIVSSDVLPKMYPDWLCPRLD
ncbi:enzyme of sugar metabolism [Bdellovibrio bacteriovorus]|uniref:Putative enzyme of sugar metabolism n=1 Tax=Bdellovibrio bacteriovorus str. Tiberius TaxID=1069642 RepID=K7Z849_BDEBC|nr:enzyme of sugar metabolism [Bdellovibrio bacteriovorus]AFY00574.1 putative enzyme of sugar metabolism [Bdellovibrio bacteriovorus str. Tiberius]